MRRDRLLRAGKGRCAQHPTRFALVCPDCFAQKVDDGTFAARARVIAAARKLIGTSFQHRGRGRGGLDCSGSCVVSFREAGFTVDDLASYSREFVGEEFLAAVLARADRVPNELDALPADVAVCRTGRVLEHLAIMTADGTIVHASGREGRVLEHELDDLWRDRIELVVRHRSLACRTPLPP